jgi:hypothetical protein
MQSFSAINDELRFALSQNREVNEAIICHIASSENIEKQVRELIPIKNLRSTGSFFTGDKLAELAITNLPIPIGSDSICIDPTCGVVNLLVAASKFLPIFDSLDKTIALWGHSLRGFDLHEEFVECAKLRLINEALYRGARKSEKSLEELESLFIHIRVGDFFEYKNSLKAGTHFLVNPPYNLRTLPEARSWGSGKVNLAAVFIEEIVKNAPSESAITAILPEVLRSGSRYSKWRGLISSLLDSSVEVFGRFNSRTDVDVINFFGKVRADVGEGKEEWVESLDGPCVEHYFNVHVGPLVAYRDKQEGVAAPYIYPKILEKWVEVDGQFPLRKTSTQLIQPPFVVVNRTSSPSDQYRAAATLVKGSQPIAVENHLIVMSPREGGVNKCRSLLRILKNESTNTYLNSRIRCRHLTVGSVKKIPWTS